MLKKFWDHRYRIIFLVVTVFSLWYLDGVLSIKNDDGIMQASAMYYQPRNTVDVVMMGSSHVHYDIDTGKLWKEHGIAAYDYSAAEQPLWMTYHYLKEICKYQKPKLLVLDVYSPALQKDDYQYKWMLPNVLGMRFSLNKLEMLRVSCEKEHYFEYFPSFAVYHGRLNGLTKDDFAYPIRKFTYLRNFKGFKPMTKVAPQPMPQITQTGVGELTEKSELYLHKIIDYAKKNGIELYFIATPYVINDEQELVFNRLKEIAGENDIGFTNANHDYDAIGLDFEKDFMDESHLNYYGAEKFTEYLGKDIAGRFDLPDHRGEKRYKSWDANCLEIEKAVNAG